MKFFQTLSHFRPVMVRLLTTQIILSLLSNMLYVTLSDIPVLLFIGTLFALGIYFYLIYLTVWEEGCHEVLRKPEEQCHVGHVTGLMIGFFSALPGFLCTLIPVLFPIAVSVEGTLGGVSNVFHIISKFFFNGEYLAVLSAAFPLQETSVVNTEIALANAKVILASLPFYLLCIIPTCLISWFAFWVGLKNRTLASLLGIEIKQKPGAKPRQGFWRK